MDQLIQISIPRWVVIIVALWFLMAALNTTLDIWLFYLRRKLARLEAATTTTTTATVCVMCNTWRASGANYCAVCGEDLKK